MTLGLPVVTYLSPDSVAEGVGASQVLAYVGRLVERGVQVRLVSFEKARPDDAELERIAALGVDWVPKEFGRHGPVGGLGRVVTAARAAAEAPLVHARSELAAASALLARNERWIWDARSLLTDQRLALGTLRKNSAERVVLRAVERAAARRSSAIVALTQAVIPELERRHGASIPPKTTVITTCVDLDRCPFSPPPAGAVRFLLAGTLNGYYDVPTMMRLVRAFRRRSATELVVAVPTTTPWGKELSAEADEFLVGTPPAGMPRLIAESTVGLSVCRHDAGVSLLAAMPTKIGEFLSTGRPVVVNLNLGDAGRIVEDERCGIALHGTTDVEIAAAVERLAGLLDDPDTPARCRDVAERRFDLNAGVDALIGVYRSAWRGTMGATESA